ncbi:NUDIX hydrolase domain-like protein [Polychytrium aggregatum]|uniref:NUDIX hydrolase domain-like protein n=1 Tax=Polychytrium aggregatum TaxID=110093 RepID=UPI0022FE9A4C|nr:NUDIX hydrolase domain-like protein [Polychytrium aggregatum]KAI9193219.1 NUDIX hydrolase domain-like protein [Polychytrium aggregatum]
MQCRHQGRLVMEDESKTSVQPAGKPLLPSAHRCWTPTLPAMPAFLRLPIRPSIAALAAQGRCLAPAHPRALPDPHRFSRAWIAMTHSAARPTEGPSSGAAPPAHAPKPEDLPPVRVGVGVFVIRKSDGAILIGKRKGSHGAGTYQLPGGHLEFGESFEECAHREVLEEAGLAIENVTFATAVNDPNPKERRHYVSIFMRGECVDANPVPVLVEPEYCEGWEFMTFDELYQREPLFGPMIRLKEQQPGFRP